MLAIELGPKESVTLFTKEMEPMRLMNPTYNRVKLAFDSDGQYAVIRDKLLHGKTKAEVAEIVQHFLDRQKEKLTLRTTRIDPQLADTVAE